MGPATHRLSRTQGRARVEARLVCAIAILGSPAAVQAVTLPDHFVAEVIPPGTHFNQPTTFAFLPDGRILVAEKRGVVRMVEHGVKLVPPVWDGSTEVLTQGDRGLIGLAVDPDFLARPYLYLLYAVDPDSNGTDLDDDAFGRLTRYRLGIAGDSNVVDTSSRTVLLGRCWSDGIPSGSPSHSVGALVFGRDGSLLVTAGDGAHFAGVDSGGRDSGLFVEGRCDTAQDRGAFRAQDLTSLAGKMLRIDPDDGGGYASNPFFDGDRFSLRSRVWALGLRNAFRFDVQPGTGSTDPSDGNPGVVLACDVGWRDWEEINVVTRGNNYGWPCFEGIGPQSLYAAVEWGGRCDAASTTNPPRPPVLVWHHLDAAAGVPGGFMGSCASGGTWCRGDQYPASWRGGYVFADFGEGWIKFARLNEQQELISIADFATEAEGPVAFASDPATGDLCYLAFMTGRLYRVRYVGPLAVEAPVERFRLSAPRPNPARGPVALELFLERETTVSLRVLDVQGREVWREPESRSLPGPHRIAWNGCIGSGDRAAAGIYFLVVHVGDHAVARRVTLFH